jgi:uncharacterized protein YeeX (DUF496 family)
MMGWLQSMLAPYYFWCQCMCGNKPKVLAAREVHHVFVNNNIRVNRKSILLEANMQKYARAENVTAHETC